MVQIQPRKDVLGHADCTCTSRPHELDKVENCFTLKCLDHQAGIDYQASVRGVEVYITAHGQGCSRLVAPYGKAPSPCSRLGASYWRVHTVICDPEEYTDR